MAVSKGNAAYVLDGTGRPASGPLPRGGAALDRTRSRRTAARWRRWNSSASSRRRCCLSPPGIAADTRVSSVPVRDQAADGSARDVAARDVIDTACLGPRLLRSDGSSEPPFLRGLCLLAANDDCACERDVARDPANDLAAPALSPDGKLLAVARSLAENNRRDGPDRPVRRRHRSAGAHAHRGGRRRRPDVLAGRSPGRVQPRQRHLRHAATGAPGSERARDLRRRLSRSG